MTDAERASDRLAEVAQRAREHILLMATAPAGAHVGGSLSATDLLVALYMRVLRLDPANPSWPDRDYFVLSKGHASAALYATLAERGFLRVEELRDYSRDGGRLAGHPLTDVPGVDFPTGSLGHGLALGLGSALVAARDGSPSRSFVLLGDGELQEGSVWEAARVAAALRLDNLVAVVDENELQINGPTGETAADHVARWASFGWRAMAIDGHDIEAVAEVLAAVPFAPGSPSAVIARTVKGKGVRFLEGRASSHHVTLTPALYQRALQQLRIRRL